MAPARSAIFVSGARVTPCRLRRQAVAWSVSFERAMHAFSPSASGDRVLAQFQRANHAFSPSASGDRALAQFPARDSRLLAFGVRRSRGNSRTNR